MDAFSLARSIQKFVNRKKTVGYSHPPQITRETAHFRVYSNGECFLVSVRPYSLMDEMAERAAELQNG